MIWNTLRRALGLDPNDRALRKYEGVVEQINELSENLESRSEDELRAMGARLRERARDEEPLEELLVEVFALVGEEAPRKWMRTRDIKALFKKGKRIRWAETPHEKHSTR